MTDEVAHVPVSLEPRYTPPDTVARPRGKPQRPKGLATRELSRFPAVILSPQTVPLARQGEKARPGDGRAAAYRYLIISSPPRYLRNTSGTTMEPSFC